MQTNIQKIYDEATNPMAPDRVANEVAQAQQLHEKREQIKLVRESWLGLNYTEMILLTLQKRTLILDAQINNNSLNGQPVPQAWLVEKATLVKTINYMKGNLEVYE